MMNRKALKKYLLDLIFPNKCPVCMKAIRWDKLICEDCKEQLVFAEKGEFCIKCGRHHAPDEQCESKKHFDNVLGVLKYEGKCKKAIYNLKHRYGLNLSEFAAPYIYKSLEENELLKSIDCITFVPMYKKKEFKRGYNQAEEYAKAIAEELKVPVISHLIEHRKSSVSQHNLSGEDRKTAAKQTYYPGKAKRPKEFKTVIIADDVFTTGSTLDICAQLLKQAGFERVICAAICITPEKNDEDKDN